MRLIAKHLDRGNLKTGIFKFKTPMICAFTGLEIMEGVRKSDTVKDTFTDHAYIRYSESDWCSIDVALCLEAVINLGGLKKSGTQNIVSIRNFSYYADEVQLRFLKVNEILPLLLNIPRTPFVVAVSYGGQKHTSFKTVECNNTENYRITTDVEPVIFNKKEVMKFLPIITKWYGMKNIEKDLTYFTKKQILGDEIPDYFRISEYGFDAFHAENNLLNQYRNTPLFRLITHILQKK